MVDDRRGILIATGVLVSAAMLLSTLTPGFFEVPARIKDPSPKHTIEIVEEKREWAFPSKEERDSKDKVPECPERCPECPQPRALEIEYRRRIARTIADVQLLISRLAGTKSVIDADWALRLGAVVEELDSTFAVSSNSSWDYSARLPDMAPLQRKGKELHVCPDVYHGSAFDAPFNQRGMETDKCSEAPPFSSVLTVLIPVRTWAVERAVFVVQQIQKHYDVPIIVIALNKTLVGQMGKEVEVLIPEEKESMADSLNSAIGMVKTPFVFLGESLEHFSNQSSLERLVRVLDDLQHVQVAGGAARDTQGHWIHGCLQQHMANYQAKYTMGYYYSKYECMYCDDLLTPFVTRTKLLKMLTFTTTLNWQAMYRDWFARVRDAGYLAVVCPDVMFFLNSHVSMTAKDWLPMARQWSLETVYSFDGTSHNFPCESVGISCNGPLNTIRSFLLPPCCRKMMETYLSYILDYGEAQKLPHELQAGSALGAVKMGSYLPWDYDMDIVFECKDFKKWLGINTVLKPKKCHATVTQRNKYITVYCPNFFLELFCHKYNFTSSVYLPKEYRHVPTTIQYAGRWVKVISNPGLYSRIKLGLDDLKHASHWRTLKVSAIGKKKGGYDNPGTWKKCKNPEHHSCLDRYPADGNLPFLQPFLRP